MKNSEFSLRIQTTNGHCPAGETAGSRMIAQGQLPVISCEGSCIRGEISRLAANMLAKQEGYGRGCHGEMLSVPHSAMAKWARQAKKIVVIDGCFLHCHGRLMEGAYSKDQLIVFDALSYYKQYTDIMDVDDVPESERKKAAELVLNEVLKAMEAGGCEAVCMGTTDCNTATVQAGCCGS